MFAHSQPNIMQFLHNGMRICWDALGLLLLSPRVVRVCDSRRQDTIILAVKYHHEALDIFLLLVWSSFLLVSYTSFFFSSACLLHLHNDSALLQRWKASSVRFNDKTRGINKYIYIKKIVRKHVIFNVESLSCSIFLAFSLQQNWFCKTGSDSTSLLLVFLLYIVPLVKVVGRWKIYSSSTVKSKLSNAINLI